MACEHCGADEPHKGRCYRIKAIEFEDDGYGNRVVKRVEYLTGADFVPAVLPAPNPFPPIGIFPPPAQPQPPFVPWPPVPTWGSG